MNKVYISGEIASAPVLTSSAKPHLIFDLLVGHKTIDGVRKSEWYCVNAWNNAARWGHVRLAQGQPVALQGYLTQRPALVNGEPIRAVDVTAEEFFLSGARPLNREPADPDARENAIIQAADPQSEPAEEA